MLCYAMLCYAMLCYAMLCYAMLCYAMQVRGANFAPTPGLACLLRPTTPEAAEAAKARWAAGERTDAAAPMVGEEEGRAMALPAEFVDVATLRCALPLMGPGAGGDWRVHVAHTGAGAATTARATITLHDQQHRSRRSLVEPTGRCSDPCRGRRGGGAPAAVEQLVCALDAVRYANRSPAAVSQ
jgi:hypothetical protein